MSDKQNCDHLFDNQETHCVKCGRTFQDISYDHIVERLKKLEQQIEKQINEFRIILLGYNKLLDNAVNRDEFLGRTMENIEAVLKRFIEWNRDYIYKTAISPPLMREDLENLLKQLEGFNTQAELPKGAWDQPVAKQEETRLSILGCEEWREKK